MYLYESEFSFHFRNHLTMFLVYHFEEIFGKKKQKQKQKQKNMKRDVYFTSCSGCQKP